MKYRILVLEDDEDSVFILRHLSCFDRQNFEIAQVVSNGKEALAEIEKNTYDLILTDINMPLINGLEFAKMLRELDKDIHIIFMSAYEDFSYAKKAIKVGALDYLVKPVKEKELEKLLIEVSKNLEEKREREDNGNIIIGSNSRGFSNKDMEEIYGLMMSERLEVYSDNNYAEAPQVDINESLEVEDKVKEYKMNNDTRVDKDIELESDVNVSKVEHDTRVSKDVKLEDDTKVTKDVKREDETKVIKVVELEHDTKVNQELELKSESLESKHKLDVNELLNRNLKGDTYQELHTTDIDYTKQTNLYNKIYQIMGNIDDTDKKYECIEKMIESIWSLIITNFKWLEEIVIFNLKITQSSNTSSNVEASIDYLLEQNIKAVSTIINKFHLYQVDATLNEICISIVNNIEAKNVFDLVSEEVELSKDYIGRLLKRRMNVTFNEYLTLFKIEYAKKLVIGSKLRVYEISERLGYESTDYFTKLFKASTGLTPLKFRKEWS